ncbi:alpha/beta fold hydrolase [Acidianus sulfidivorans JP7]|uniref:S9 family peptidase n=1 Tax=Acidianus sulfidivorans JP7 TaxID=619593 RepID=A0A2U9IPE9_9CREN|nr:S9 family peptidase [Acidianus sulfidivorans]AWR97920.1 alpha/beta fold hydrolase [Acidianus sulfidivorans JP7]
MNYDDLFKITPVYEYDVLNSNLAYIVRKKKPIAVINEEEINLDGYVDYIKWINNNKAFITLDPSGGEIRKILMWENGKISRIIDDQYDNNSPYPVNSGFLFISNREDDTLHLYFMKNYEEIIKISKGKLPVSNFCVSNKYLVYSQGIYDNDIFISDFNGNIIDHISFPNSEQYPSTTECFINDEEFLFLSNHKNYLNLYKYNIMKRNITPIVEENHEIYEAIPYNGITYVRDNNGDYEILNNGKIIINEGYNFELKVDNDYLYFLSSSYDHSFDIFRFGKNQIEKLTDSMKNINDKNFVKPTKVKYTSDNIEINALLYEKSKDDSKGVVYIHGGPDWECLNYFNPEIQLFVENGFKVICPNFRGSTGYGREFNHLNDRDLGGGDLRDVVNATKVLGTKKVAVTGASYGGYLTMMSITKYPDLWCSAVAVVPFVNWFTEKKFEREVLRQYDEIKMGDDENLLRDRSPIFFIDKIKTPLMILAGENDPRCPAEETEQIVKELEKLGKEVKYKIYKNEGHGFQQIENYVDSIKCTVEFIKNHCK